MKIDIKIVIDRSLEREKRSWTWEVNFVLEIFSPGDLERECFEEQCTDEELFEVYDNPTKHYEIKSIFDVCHR